MTEQRMRFNAKGAYIPSNFGIDKLSESIYRCTGCGREFNVHKMRRSSGFAWSTDGNRQDALNEARALRHADACKGER